MSSWQSWPSAPDPVDLRLGKRTASLSVDGGPRISFRLHRVERVAVALVDDEILPIAKAGQDPLLVSFAQASPEARALLRDQRVSYAADDGELFLCAPPVFVERPGRRARQAPGRDAWELRNPFARHSSRIMRWLLLNLDASFSVRELAHAAQLSDATASRTVRALEADGLVSVETDPADPRAKHVSIRRPRQALDAWSREWTKRRKRIYSWDVGGGGPQATLATWAAAASPHPELDWAVSGVLGASLLRPAVEPADALIWVRDEDVHRWQELLAPGSASPGSAPLRVAVALDPFIFGLTTTAADVRLADPVQLWLDCSSSGERALEAADAVRKEMGW